MNRLLLSVFFAFAPISVMAGPQEDAQAVFEKFLADFTAADADAVASNFAPEAMFWGTLSRDLITTPAGVKQYFVTAFERLPGAKASPVGRVSVVQVSDDTLALAGVWQIDRVEKGKAVSIQSRNGSTIVKRDGRWMIVSFSNSPHRAP
ncbi:MAG: DUF4440 domain-containing protein [Beijerinckiaceae bacterium]|nr:DUF4440 domain-containing protein [Beijerinckiaceae bacterium]